MRLVACAAAIALLAGPALAESACRSWPGEPDPLPTSTDSDPALARWAQLRSLEMRAFAEESARDPITADRLLRHADCLSPLRNPPPEAPVPRARLAVRVHRPGLELVSRGSDAVPAETVAAAFAQLGESLPIARRLAPAPRKAVVQPRPTNAANVQIASPSAASRPSLAAVRTADEPPVQPPADPVAVERAPEPVAVLTPLGAVTPPGSVPPPVSETPPGSVPTPGSETPPVSAAPPPGTLAAEWLADAGAALAAARFEEALEKAAAGRAALATETDLASRSASAELEVLSGTAALALGRGASASEHFSRARSLQPGLELDPTLHSPKVVRAFSRAEGTP